MNVVSPEICERAGKTAAEHLDWLGGVMLQSGDMTGALLAARMVRHLIPDGYPERRLGFSPSWLYAELGHIAQKAFPEAADRRSVVAPFDAILAELRQRTRVAKRPLSRRPRNVT